jgi:glutaminyl-peptide cyclotransferase
MHHSVLLTCIFLLCVMVSCTSKKSEQKIAAPRISYSIVNQLAHDRTAFTEGLLIHNGNLYESTGEENHSWIGVVNTKGGTTDKKIILDGKYFGEGITILNKKIYQLTYKTQVGFVYDLDSFKQINQFSYPMKQGWGLTHDTKTLIMSDGTDKLYFLDTTNLSVVKTVSVTDDSGPLSVLNELEYINGSIYANVWLTDRIVKIDPATGQVKGVLDLTTICNAIRSNHPHAKEMNGIAWHEATQSLLITGKHWPLIYVLRIKEAGT